MFRDAEKVRRIAERFFKVLLMELKVSISQTSITIEDEAETPHDSFTATYHATLSPSSEIGVPVWSKTSKGLGCPTCGRRHSAACKKRKVMLDSDAFETWTT